MDLVLSYFNISIKTVVNNPTGQENITYVGGGARSLWNDYLAKPFSNVLNSTVVKGLWDSFITNMQYIHDGKPTDFQRSAPIVPIN